MRVNRNLIDNKYLFRSSLSLSRYCVMQMHTKCLPVHQISQSQSTQMKSSSTFLFFSQIASFLQAFASSRFCTEVGGESVSYTLSSFLSTNNNYTWTQFNAVKYKLCNEHQSIAFHAKSNAHNTTSLWYSSSYLNSVCKLILLLSFKQSHTKRVSSSSNINFPFIVRRLHY